MAGLVRKSAGKIPFLFQYHDIFLHGFISKWRDAVRLSQGDKIAKVIEKLLQKTFADI